MLITTIVDACNSRNKALSSSYYFGAANGMVSSFEQGAIANPDVTWEKERKLNIGLDATLLKNVSVSFDAFRQNRNDILAIPYGSVPSFLGLNLPQRNVGKVKSSGFEGTIHYHTSQDKKLPFFVKADIWHARNEIVYNAEALRADRYLYRSGQPVGQPFVLEALGFFRDQADIDASPRQTFAAVQPGDLKYKDQNGDGLVDQRDFFPIGNTGMPELTLGLQ
ncbi:MAG: TonB-dependent receptor, partial [Flavobacterium sp.]